MREVFAGSKVQITPEAKRLLLARLGADRALSRAEIDKLVLYAHGKSTIEESDVEAAVGDAAELETLIQARRADDPSAPPAAVGSIKANIGHTKAAAGVAGLIKSVKAGRVEPGATVVLTLTGHGLKDPDTALESASRPATVPPSIDAVLAQLGL
jgi:enediyne polyketide synthase